MPAGPVLVPLAAVLLGASWFALRHRGVLTVPRLVTAWATVFYLCGVLAVTLLPLQVVVGRYASQGPWYERANFVPLLTIDVTTFVLNIALTVPLGVLLPLLGRARSTKSLVWWALCFSGAIELVQFATNVFLSSGRTADVNDLFANVLGAVVGFVVVRRLAGDGPAGRLLSRMAVPGRAGDDAARNWDPPARPDGRVAL
ncbi:VanZ family protein [Cryptosporangium sp. NPDC051539]|uniref:VanZ family protein n=1 Tax=Cryptosporangium sp. NPDC051539 TaxID=3363962 RepID=UPI003795C482